jgi:exodeoxyribonuclease VII large subunit
MSETIDALLAQGGTAASGDSAAAADPAVSGRKVYTVGQYNRGVERRIKEIPTTWVKGVITQLQPRGKVVYLTLAEFDEGDTRPKAVLDVIIWAGQFESFNARFALLPTPFVLRPELKVSLLLEAGFYVPSGRFQTKVLDIDESFTLGELAQTRLKILEALRREGLLEANKRRFLPPVPLRVGLISSRGSAAYQDFTTVLLQSGFSFDILFAEARMQGQDTESTVAAALAKLSRQSLDVICLVRGGGSKTDLVYFDSEKICRAIAACPVPVITGIGHEIDRSLADMVAYEDLLTPTDCAKFLEGRAAEAWNDLVTRASTLREAWETAYQDEGFATVQRAQQMRSAWDGRARREVQKQSDVARNIILASNRLIRACREKISLNRTGLLRGPEKIVRLETLRLELKAKSLQASDPVALLKRGFAQVVSASGQWIRGAKDAVAGDAIRVRFADGTVAARVESIERTENTETKES